MPNDDTLRRALRSYALYVALGVVVGVVVAPAFTGVVQTDRPQPVVAVVPIEGTIDGTTAAEVRRALVKVRASERVEAVVVAANSGGGAATASEELYFAVKRTEQSGIPVIASVDGTAASGAYYAVAPADRIFVKPSSTVGSIGVVAQLPAEVEPNDVLGTTGPNKLTGADAREFLYILESIHAGFVNSVLEQRGDELTLSRAELEQAQIYSGGQAVRNGLADEVGDREAAIRVAAREAGLDSYSVRVVRPRNGTVTFVSREAHLASDADTGRIVPPERLLGNRTGGPTFLMVGPEYFASSRAVVSARAVEDALDNDTDARGNADNDTSASENDTAGGGVPVLTPGTDATRSGATAPDSGVDPPFPSRPDAHPTPGPGPVAPARPGGGPA